MNLLPPKIPLGVIAWFLLISPVLDRPTHPDSTLILECSLKILSDTFDLHVSTFFPPSLLNFLSSLRDFWVTVIDFFSWRNVKA